MRIREGHDVARAGIDLPVAPQGVRPHHLRPAVDVQDQWILLGGIEAVGFHQEDVDGLAIGPLDPLFLRGPEVHLGRQGLVEVRDPPRLARGEGVAPDLHRFPHAGLGEEDRLLVRAHRELLDAQALEHPHALAGGHVGAEEGPAALLLHGEPEGLAVGGPLEGVHPVVDGFGEHLPSALGAVVDGQAVAVGLMARLDLQPVGDEAPVRRILGIAVRGGVVAGDAAGGAIAIEGDEEEVVVGAAGRHRIGVGGDTDLLAVGTQVPGLPEARVVLLAGGEGLHLAIRCRAEQVRVMEVPPLGPVPVEQRVRQVGLHGTRLQLRAQVLVLGAVRHGLGEHRGLEDHAAAGPQLRCADPRLEVRDLAGLAAAGVQDPELAAALAGGQEVEGLAVLRPQGGGVGLTRESELLRGPGRGLQHPELGVPLGGLQVLAGHLKGQPGSVWAQGQVLDALQPVQVLDLEGPLLGREGRDREDEQREQEAAERGHGTSRRGPGSHGPAPPWYPGP